jgi:serine/threonine protein kinase
LKLIAGSVLADRYRISHRLGEGGMGQVWAAVHVVTGRRVAVKRLLLANNGGDDDPGDSQARARFVLEAQAACAVEHPNVVQVLDFMEPGNEPPLLVMELLQGETLADKLIRDQTLSLADTASLLAPVVSAVGAAHSLGIIHRDLKPANIFLHEAAGQPSLVKVLDFGIAKWVSRRPLGAGLRTQTGSTLGTPCYMAPEQAIGDRLIDHRVDAWSLGVILYECLTGARPLEGENPAQMVVRLLNTGIVPIEHVLPTLPADVCRLIGKMLARDPKKRPSDLREVLAVLQRYTPASSPTFAAPAVESTSTDFTSEPRTSLPAVWVPKTLSDEEAEPLESELRVAPVKPSRSARVRWAVASLLVTAAFVITSQRFFATSVASPQSASSSQLKLAVRDNSPAMPTKLPLLAPIPVAQDRSPSMSPIAAQQIEATMPQTRIKAAPAPQRVAALQRPAALAVSPLSSSASASASPAGAAVGATCERSRDCESRLCVAFVCE